MYIVQISETYVQMRAREIELERQSTKRLTIYRTMARAIPSALLAMSYRKYPKNRLAAYFVNQLTEAPSHIITTTSNILLWHTTQRALHPHRHRHSPPKASVIRLKAK